MITSTNLTIIYFLLVLPLQTNYITVYPGSAFLRLKVQAFKTVQKLQTKFDDSMSIKHFSGLQVLVLEPQTNLMMAYW